MEKTLIRSKNIVDETGRRYTLYYWLLKREVLDDRNNIAGLYGVEIEKYQGSEQLEVEQVECLCRRKSQTLKFLRKLAEGNVTPMCLLEVADEFISIENQAV